MGEVRADVRVVVQGGDTRVRASIDYNAPPFPTDAVTVTDAVAFTPLITKLLTDTATMSDATGLFISPLRLSDDATVDDSMSKASGFVLSPTETVGLNDNTVSGTGLAKDLADAVTMTESTQRDRGIALSLADNVTMSEAPTPLLSNISFVASNEVIASVDIPVSGTSAQVGDLILCVSPYGTVTPSGAGWTVTTYTWFPGLDYQGTVYWKVLTSLSDIPVTGDQYGSMWAIYRGPTTVAKVVGDDNTGSTHNITWPSPAPSCVGQVMMMHQQQNTDNVPATGFTSRSEAYNMSVFRLEVHDRLSSVAAGSSIVTSTGNQPHYINGFELRA